MLQTGNIQELSLWIIITCLVLLAAAVILGVVILYYRRRWLNAGETAQGAWTLEDLRKLREQGELSEDEYQAMRKVLIGACRGQAAQADGAGAAADAGDS
jgi:uncharacterized membrane protein